MNDVLQNEANSSGVFAAHQPNSPCPNTSRAVHLINTEVMVLLGAVKTEPPELSGAKRVACMPVPKMPAMKQSRAIVRIGLWVAAHAPAKPPSSWY
jgi:hypothetical protein